MRIVYYENKDTFELEIIDVDIGYWLSILLTLGYNYSKIK